MDISMNIKYVKSNTLGTLQVHFRYTLGEKSYSVQEIDELQKNTNIKLNKLEYAYNRLNKTY